MRTVRLWLVVSLLALPWMGTVQPSGSIDMPGVAIAQENAPAPAQGGGPDIEVKIDGGGTERTVVWFSNPFVLAAGAIAVLVVVMLIVMASRGGGTTIVKD